jgi:3-mercaptopropionate dioxygenase
MVALHGSNDPALAGMTEPSLPLLQQMFADIAVAVAGEPERRHRLVAAALVPYLNVPELLQDMSCPCSPDRYVRHLLHAGETYSVLAIVWRPGQMSPVHGHRTWCALGIHRGSMTEMHFGTGSQLPIARSSAQLAVGDISHAPGEPDAIHRLANLGTETAISIHVYGARHDRLGDAVNHVWAA